MDSDGWTDACVLLCALVLSTAFLWGLASVAWSFSFWPFFATGLHVHNTVTALLSGMDAPIREGYVKEEILSEASWFALRWTAPRPRTTHVITPRHRACAYGWHKANSVHGRSVGLAS